MNGKGVVGEIQPGSHAGRVAATQAATQAGSMGRRGKAAWCLPSDPTRSWLSRGEVDVC